MNRNYFFLRDGFAGLLLLFVLPLGASPLPQPANTWTKRSPLSDTPPSPRLGYEGACVWDSRHHVVIRYGGHNQGGGGEQGSEIWTFDPLTGRWTLKEPNTSPPGVCCNAQNVFDPVQGRYLRFPSFSGSHGWQWWREIYLNDSTVWTYDLAANEWRNLRPLPAPHVAGLRCASWDIQEQAVVVFGGEGSQEGTVVYDPYLNQWRWMKPEPEPAFRSGGNMAYDAARGVHVLFGAQFTDDPHTWIYDLRKNQWRDARPPQMPPTDKNDAVLCYDPIHKVVLALIKISTGEDDDARHRLETWSYDTAANRWTKLNPNPEPDPTGNRARQLLFAPELHRALLENRTHPPQGPSEQQIWTYRFSDNQSEAEIRLPEPKPRAQPRLVEEAVVSVISTREVTLRWTPPKDPSVTGYHIERAAVEVLTEDQLKRLKSRTPPLPEPSVGALKRIGPFQRLTQTPLASPSFKDTTVDLTRLQPISGQPTYSRVFNEEQYDLAGKAYRFAVHAYRIRSVNANGLESGPSPAFFTLPSAPQNLFSREDGTACELKWVPNPETGLQGYRVYRLDGRWDKDPLTRLTADPVPGPSFRDPTAGSDTRRYHVLAVDALGQEGFPSAPVWFDREWRAFYGPFTGPWHQ